MFSLHFIMNKSTSWDDFFTGDHTNYTDNLHINISKNFWIYECRFANIENTDVPGSCICKDSSSNTTLLVEHSSFNTCSSSFYGGAIYFSDEGQCVLSSVCGVKCKAGERDSSVTLTKKEHSWTTLELREGDPSCKGVNVSNNEVGDISGILILHPTTCSISFSSFRNNKANGWICLACDREFPVINYTNIIENNQQSSSYGIIEAGLSSHLTMTHCSVYGNCQIGSGTVFHIYDGSIICIDCSISDDQKSSTYGSVIFNEEPSTSFINYYKYLELDSCKAGLDEWSDMKLVIPTKLPKKETEFINTKSQMFYNHLII